MTMTVPQLTEDQHEIFEALHLNEFDNLALVSTVEKTTGKHRALVMSVNTLDDEGGVALRPVAMLLDDESDLDLFEPPSEDVAVKD